MATKTFNPLDGVSDKTTKPELMERLRKAATMLRRDDRKQKSRVQEIEDRIRAKQGVDRHQQDLVSAIVCATAEEWADSIEFLEEFDDLVPVALQRLMLGGRALIGHADANGD